MKRRCRNCNFFFPEPHPDMPARWGRCAWYPWSLRRFPFWVRRPSRRVHANWGKGCLAWKRKEAAK